MKTALITGVTGQDGSFLAEQLIEKGYDVHGIVMRSATFDRENIDQIGKLSLHYGDLTDFSSLSAILTKVKPDEIYNLAAQSHVGISWKIPVHTAQVTGLGVLNLLEAVRISGLNSKIYQASTSEMFSGEEDQLPQNENTPFDPRSPYSSAKLFAHQMCHIYRRAYNMFICCGILFNHESERRGKNFVTRKITVGISDILKGKQKKIHLGNLDAKRDWGYAPDYTDAMWRMLQQKTPDDYVISTGEFHSVQEFAERAFKFVDKDWRDYIEIKDDYIRPSETSFLLGDASKAKRVLGWEPTTSFDQLVEKMVTSDLKS